MISVHFQGKPFNIIVIQVYAPTSNAEEAEVEWFYEDLQDLLELTSKKDVHFIIGAPPNAALAGFLKSGSLFLFFWAILLFWAAQLGCSTSQL